MCRLLKVSPQGFYDWRDRQPSKRALEGVELLDRIETLYEESDGVKGALRIHDDLRDEGYRCGKNRVARLMRENGLQGLPQKRRWRGKKSEPWPLRISNELERMFSADQRNEKWVTDITYIKTDVSALYLCFVKDFCDGQTSVD